MSGSVSAVRLSTSLMVPKPMGSWTFNDPGRPVKAVAIGDSIAAYTQGSFVAFLQAACPRLEVVNLAKPLIGADVIRERFLQQVLHNPRLKRARRTGSLDDLSGWH